jgi:hypothetical protein
MTNNAKTTHDPVKKPIIFIGTNKRESNRYATNNKEGVAHLSPTG